MTFDTDALHAVQNQSSEYKYVVALIVFNIFHSSSRPLCNASGLAKQVSINEVGPWLHTLSSLCDPFLYSRTVYF